MHLFEFALLDVSAAAETRRLGQRTGGPVEAAKMLIHFGNDRPMLDRAGGGDHDIGRAIIAREVSAQLAAIERTHGFWRAQDRAAERLIGERDDL